MPELAKPTPLHLFSARSISENQISSDHHPKTDLWRQPLKGLNIDNINAPQISFSTRHCQSGTRCTINHQVHVCIKVA
jgi:hypothetical protein